MCVSAALGRAAARRAFCKAPEQGKHACMLSDVPVAPLARNARGGEYACLLCACLLHLTTLLIHTRLLLLLLLLQFADSIPHTIEYSKGLETPQAQEKGANLHMYSIPRRKGGVSMAFSLHAEP